MKRAGWLIVFLVALVGCSSPAQVVSGSGVAGSDQSQSGSPATAKVGDLVKIGDWDVTITKVTKNANAIIRRANPYNSKPKHQYVLVDYKAKYVGDERKSDARWGLSWSFTDSTQKVMDETSAVTPADNANKPTEARKGGTISQQVVFDVDPKRISGGLLSVENLSDYADFRL